MKIYGYSKSSPDLLLEMQEITIKGEAHSLRAIAKLLLECADKIEEKANWEHEHLQDEWLGWSDDMPDLIVYNPHLSK